MLETVPAPQQEVQGTGSGRVTGDSTDEERHFRKNKSQEKGTGCVRTQGHGAGRVMGGAMVKTKRSGSWGGAGEDNPV